jgi:hypothetical protein
MGALKGLAVQIWEWPRRVLYIRLYNMYIHRERKREKNARLRRLCIPLAVAAAVVARGDDGRGVKVSVPWNQLWSHNKNNKIYIYIERSVLARQKLNRNLFNYIILLLLKLLLCAPSLSGGDTPASGGGEGVVETTKKRQLPRGVGRINELFYEKWRSREMEKKKWNHSQ